MSPSNRDHVIVHSNNSAYTIDPDNPYIPIEVANNPSTPLLNSYIDMPPDILKKAIEFQSLKCPVRIVTAFDVFMSMYYFYVSWLLGTIFVSGSMGGFMATIYYKKSMMTCYVGYQYFQVIGRMTNLGYFIYIVANPNSNATIQTNNSLIHLNTSSPDNYTAEIVISLCFLFAQIYIAKVVTRFYNLLPCDLDRDRITYSSV